METAFDRHKETFFPKENVSVLTKRLCVYVCLFSFKNGIYLIVKTTLKYVFANLSHLYVIKFTNYKIEKSDVTY